MLTASSTCPLVLSRTRATLPCFDPGEFPLNPRSSPSTVTLAGGEPAPPPVSSGSLLPRAAQPLVTPNPFASLAEPEPASPVVDPAHARPVRVTARPDVYDPSALAAQRAHDAAAAANTTVAGQEEQEEEQQEEEEPKSLAHALRLPSRGDWLKAVAGELLAHRQNGTWSPVDAVPARRSALPARWVFKAKRDVNGAVSRYKARLVVKGFRQRAFVDYDETFAPTLRIPTFRALCAAACLLGLHIHTMDVSTAFLVPSLEEEIYMAIPEQELVNEHLPRFSTSQFVRLKKALYGLKQSPRLWYKHFSSTLDSMGFKQANADPCLWVKIDQGQLIAAIAHWVDDCVIVASENLMDRIKSTLKQTYKMTDDGPATWFLAVRIRHDVNNQRLTLDQGPTVARLLQQYRMEDCKAVSTPCDSSIRSTVGMPPATEEETTFITSKPYRSLVGKLLYLLFTRPDLSFAVNQLTRHLNDPRKIHWTAAIRVLRYLRGCPDLGISYSANEQTQSTALSQGPISGYSDSDWAGELNSRRSTSGFVFMMCGGPISFRTKLQPSVATSTTAAEIMALAFAFKEALWLRQLARELQLPGHNAPFSLFEDNQGAIALAKENRFSDRAKHIDIQYFFIREHLELGTFLLHYCDTKDMLADILTKPLAQAIFSSLLQRLMPNEQ